MSVNYIAIIGDIKGSKKLENRSDAQEKLNSILNYVNNRYEKQIAAKFLITLGDEFQGLLSGGEHLIEIVKYIQKQMYPIKIRFGIGIGEIHTEINSEAAIGADGPAYYAARNTIEELHEQEKKLKKQASDMQISLYNRKHVMIDQINAILSLMNIIEESWTDKQRYTVWDMEENGGSQTECAKRMDTTQSTVARRIADSNYITYEHAKESLSGAIKWLMIDIGV